MDGIPGLYRRTVTTSVQRPAAQSTQAQKAAASSGVDSFQSMLTEAERAEQAAKAAPLPNFSKMTDKQKLSALATLHDATDYSGMTDVEKYKLIQDRFEAAFPHVLAYDSGIFGPQIVIYHDESERQPKGLSELIHDEEMRQWKTSGLYGKGKIGELHREAYYGGMTDEETIAAISKRHKGGTIADRADTLEELRMLKLDKGTATGALNAMRSNLVRMAKGSDRYAGFFTENHSQETAIYKIATGSHVSWGAIGKMVSDSWNQWEDKLADGYSKNIQESFDELLEDLMNVGD